MIKLTRERLKGPASFSRLRTIHEMGARGLMFDRQETTKSMAFGRYFHHKILTPETLDQHYRTVPDNINLRTNAGKEYLAAIVMEGITPVKQIDQERADFMAAILHVNSDASSLLQIAGEKEKSVEGVINDVEVVGRVDLYHDQTIVEIKTTSNKNMEFALLDLEKNLVAEQLYIYSLLLGIETPNLEVIVCQSCEPYDVKSHHVFVTEETKYRVADLTEQYKIAKDLERKTDSDFDLFVAL